MQDEKQDRQTTYRFAFVVGNKDKQIKKTGVEGQKYKKLCDKSEKKDQTKKITNGIMGKVNEKRKLRKKTQEQKIKREKKR